MEADLNVAPHYASPSRWHDAVWGWAASTEGDCRASALFSTSAVSHPGDRKSLVCSIMVARKHSCLPAKNAVQHHSTKISGRNVLHICSTSCSGREAPTAQTGQFCLSLKVTATFLPQKTGGRLQPDQTISIGGSTGYESIINLDYGNRVASLWALKMTYYVSAFFPSSSRYFGLKCK